MWTEIIEPRRSLFDLRLKEIWHYRDLLTMFVRRDFVASYKQSILGPLWFFIQPLLTTLTFTVVFGRFAKIPTDGLPPVLFYLAGVTIWSFFSESFTKTATVFKDNAGVFGKVYFPRLIMPLSIVVSALVRFSIQFILFLGFVLYFKFSNNTMVHPNWMILLIPILLFLMAGIALGSGMIISSLTTKYRDLVFLLSFGVQLLMYATPVIYPLSSLSPKYQNLVMINPITSILETFRYAFLGVGSFSWGALAYSAVFTFVLMLGGTLVFNRVQNNFMDTV